MVDINRSQGAGNYIKVDHGNGLESSYSHTGIAADLSVGDVVVRGQVIGFSDSSGRIFGPHLHFVVRLEGVRIDPCIVVSCP